MNLIIVLLIILTLNCFEAIKTKTKSICQAYSCQDCVKYSNCDWCDTRCIEKSDKMSCSNRISDSAKCQAQSERNCEYKGHRYNIGEKFMDDCNNCTCLESGSVSCTLKLCSRGCETVRCRSGYSCVEEDNGPICRPNSGGCDTVRCIGRYTCIIENNLPVCKLISGATGCEAVLCMIGTYCYITPNGPVCAPIGETCTYLGITYTEGYHFPAGDGCNTCTCSSGQVSCTEKACNTEIPCHTNTDCHSDFFCAKESCEDTDLGICTSCTTDMACTTQYDPVCGCDNKTYSNSCEAAKSCVNIKSSGICQSQPQLLNCRNNNDCGSQDYCAKVTCDCEQGMCTKKNLGCNRRYDPVCGCDGRTYSNLCEAGRLGANVKSNGECNESGGRDY
jgi:hypothetical protein